MAKIKKLKSNNEYTYPVTVEKAIYDSNGNRLDNKLATFAKSSEVNTRFTSVENSIATFSSDLGDAWNSSTTYKVGDYCIYSNALYKCKVQNSNTVPTNATYWTKVTVGGELGTINRDLSEITGVNITSSGGCVIDRNNSVKSNRLVIINILIDARNFSPAGGWNVVAQISNANLCPLGYIDFITKVDNESKQARIRSDGKIEYYEPTSSPATPQLFMPFTVSYLV